MSTSLIELTTPLYDGQRFHNVFAYGCPDRGREFDKKSDKELFKRLHNICNYY